ncbi:MAG: phosphoribosylamine--glycine ligase [Actinomycetota bacterium]
MKVLVVGSGGREHALAWALSRSSIVDGLVLAPGNPGMSVLGACIDVSLGDPQALADAAERVGAGLVVVGPEAPLVGGLGDELRRRGLRVLGPGRSGARLEGSKWWAKELMVRAGIPTARGAVFERTDEAMAFARRMGAPLVVKADGLAAGKGVRVCGDLVATEEAIVDTLERRVFGDAGRQVVVEECLTGEELSVLALCDGTTVLPLEPAQDYKRAHDGDRGPNTGGMGSYSPVPSCPPALLDRVIDEVLEPVAGALADEAEPYVGVIYAGLMLTPDGPKVLEFNCRFGDPETQALVPRLDSDLGEAFAACVEGSLDSVELRWRPQACVAVVGASEGYPAAVEGGKAIRGVEEAEARTGVPVFHAGTARGSDGSVVTAGGRVLAVAGLGDDFAEARRRAYDGIAAVSFDGMWYRRDIGARAEGHRPVVGAFAHQIEGEESQE